MGQYLPAAQNSMYGWFETSVKITWWKPGIRECDPGKRLRKKHLLSMSSAGILSKQTELRALLSNNILSKEKKIQKKNVFFTISKNILNSCPKCNEFPTLWNHFIFSLFLAKSLLETFLLFGLLALTLRYFSLQDFSFFYIKCIFGDLLWFPWIKTEEQDD